MSHEHAHETCGCGPDCDCHDTAVEERPEDIQVSQEIPEEVEAGGCGCGCGCH